MVLIIKKKKKLNTPNHLLIYYVHTINNTYSAIYRGNPRRTKMEYSAKLPGRPPRRSHPLTASAQRRTSEVPAGYIGRTVLYTHTGDFICYFV